MWMFMNDEQLDLVKSALELLGERTEYCETSEKCDEILASIRSQQTDANALDRIMSYKCVQNLDDALWNTLAEDQADIEKYLPDNKTITYVLVVDDKEPDDDEDYLDNDLEDIFNKAMGDFGEQDLKALSDRSDKEHEELMVEISEKVTLAMMNMGFMHPDADIVGEITTEAYNRAYGDPTEQDTTVDLRDIGEIIDEIMEERYL